MDIFNGKSSVQELDFGVAPPGETNAFSSPSRGVATHPGGKLGDDQAQGKCRIRGIESKADAFRNGLYAKDRDCACFSFLLAAEQRKRRSVELNITYWWIWVRNHSILVIIAKQDLVTTINHRKKWCFQYTLTPAVGYDGTSGAIYQFEHDMPPGTYESTAWRSWHPFSGVSIVAWNTSFATMGLPVLNNLSLHLWFLYPWKTFLLSW